MRDDSHTSYVDIIFLKLSLEICDKVRNVFDFVSKIQGKMEGCRNKSVGNHLGIFAR